jgi:hypothetical protein
MKFRFTRWNVTGEDDASDFADDALEVVQLEVGCILGIYTLR